MKKTIVKPDGTTETIEGTAEEIAAYERSLKKGSLKEAPPKKKEILKGKSLEEMIREYMEKNPPPPQYIFNPIPRMEHAPECQLVEAQRGWWSVVPPRCTCGLITYPDQSYRIIYKTTTGDSVKVGDVICNGGVTANGLSVQ